MYGGGCGVGNEAAVVVVVGVALVVEDEETSYDGRGGTRVCFRQGQPHLLNIQKINATMRNPASNVAAPRPADWLCSSMIWKPVDELLSSVTRLARLSLKMLAMAAKSAAEKEDELLPIKMNTPTEVQKQINPQT